MVDAGAGIPGSGTFIVRIWLGKEMITYCTGDIFDSKADVLVNPVNTIGLLGGGLALEFLIRFPEIKLEYQKACKRRVLRIGYPWQWNNPGGKPDVLCFPTKGDWRKPSRLDFIRWGLEWVKPYQNKGIIAFPKLGCGLGGLDWEEVRPVMEKYLGSIGGTEIEIWLGEGK